LVVVPSTFSQVKESKFLDFGFNIVIYANDLLRSTYPAMETVARAILKNERAYEQEKNLISIKNILKLIPGTV